MTPQRKPAPAGLDACKAVLDGITGGDGTIEIAHPVTLPGRPVTVRLSAGEVADYLLATGWEKERRDDDVMRFFKPRRHATPHPVRLMPGVPVPVKMIERVAKWEGRHPLDVADDIIARRKPVKGTPRDVSSAVWDSDAEEAIHLADAATPDWNVGGLDAGDGRRIVTDGPVPLDHIRISTPYASGVSGSRKITPEQRDADARFIAAARIGWPRDAARVRALLAEGGKQVKAKRAKRKG